MTQREQIDLMKFNISRYDHYYDSVNNKANFWLAFNSFAIGAVLASYSTAKELVVLENRGMFSCGVAVFTILSVFACILIMVASSPHLNARRRAANATRSLLYFDDVAAMDVVDYRNELDSADIVRETSDMTGQAHSLAMGLARKYKILSYVGRMMILSLLVLLYMIYLYIGK
jgi:hypothetical protein